MSLEFELIPEKLPVAKKLKKGSKYDKVLTAFVESKEISVWVNVSGIDYRTLSAGLKNRVRSRSIKNIKVCLRGNKVYLVKE